MSNNQTDHERIIAQEIIKTYQSFVEDIPRDYFDDLKIQLVTRSGAKNLLVIKINGNILNVIQQKPHKILMKLRSMFSNVLFFLVRDGGKSDSCDEFNYVPQSQKRIMYELWAKDICTPAIYEMRTTSVLNTGEKVDTVYISKLPEHDEDYLKAMEKVYNFLTGQTLLFKHISN
ncbi:hypothetical protein H312_02172 [Anncaliia algerae PRA339]|uniref:Uncharacterized protein n=1 Tax=Anncaliia algerae PRA339 TaxID=1288291 RepID=A0A059EZH6_9MICR|nr:hypothetical protein H312_02172 [Anncaliia algerae PRA339]